MPKTGILSAPGLLVALHLLGDVAQGIEGAFAVEFVDRNELGKVQHVDFFQLAGGTELERDHIDGDVHMRHDGRVALADAGGFDQDYVETRRLAGGDHVRQGFADFTAEVPRGKTPHENPLIRAFAGHCPGRDGVHADAVTEQRAAAFAA